MSEKLPRVATNYLPVSDPIKSAQWYVKNLGASYGFPEPDEGLAIINMANQSFFLIRSKAGETANFIEHGGKEMFSLTFEVPGLEALQRLHHQFKENGVEVGEVEHRGHPGRNFVFVDPDGNKFDVWSGMK